jgi:hypothetical protein
MTDEQADPLDLTAVSRQRRFDFRAPVVEAIRGELDAIGARLRTLRADTSAELDRLGAFLEVATEAGIAAGEIAKLADVSRQTVLNLRTQGRGGDRTWEVGLQIMLSLGCHGPQTKDGLAGSLAQGPIRKYEVASAFEELLAEELVALLGIASSGEGPGDSFYYLTVKGAAALPARLRLAAMPASLEWTAYVESAPGEAGAVADAGQRWLGRGTVVVIPAGTTRDMAEPEVAFRVEAPSGELAAAAAIERFRALLERAALPRRDPVVVKALVPPSG